MARKKKHEEHENHERWLVSYADFITLLFAFFTSMYAISSVNEGKFRVLSESLAVSFNSTIYTSTSGGRSNGPSFVKQGSRNLASDFRSMYSNKYEKVKDALKDLEKDKKLSFIFDENMLTIRISDNILFQPGKDELIEAAHPVLDEIISILKTLPNDVRIEGHTDNIPINTPRFSSNWDLSSARAIAILKYFVNEHGFDPAKLSALGHGEYRPIATNDTPSGRLKNRRVDIMVLGSD
ncbi:MAG: flagellar motor protein MotB [Thermodesulfobacteriota bacterium]